MDDITIYDRKMMLINLPKTKTGIERSFTIVGEFFIICKAYIDLRPKNCKSNRFFLNYCNGKCTNQPVGINKIGAMPSIIASFLNLVDANLYTAHSFRRTSATLLAESGGDITAIKKLGGWKSTSVAESYIDSSLKNKRKIGEQITNSVGISKPSTSTSETETEMPKSKRFKNNSATVNENQQEPITTVPDTTEFSVKQSTIQKNQQVTLNPCLNNEHVSFILNNSNVNVFMKN